MGFPSASVIRNPPIMQEPQDTWVQSLGQEEPLEEGIWQPTAAFFPEESHAQRSPVSYTAHRVAKSQTWLK